MRSPTGGFQSHCGEVKYHIHKSHLVYVKYYINKILQTYIYIHNHTRYTGQYGATEIDSAH